MAQPPFIAKPLKGSENSFKRGHRVEREQSIIFHAHSVPLLVASSVLRSREMGQIDLARISKTKTGRFIEVGEVKSSIVGIEAIERSQKARLYASCNFLGKIFSLGVKLIKLVG